MLSPGSNKLSVCDTTTTPTACSECDIYFRGGIKRKCLITPSKSPLEGTLPVMPTPESESFKAAKPTVPPTFDGVDFDDNKALKAAQDAIIREQWVQSMMARLIREEMGKCYYREGVNHLEKCGHLRGTWSLSGTRWLCCVYQE